MPPIIPRQRDRSLDDLLDEARCDEARRIRDEIDQLRGAFISLGERDPYAHGEIGGLYRAFLIAAERARPRLRID